MQLYRSKYLPVSPGLFHSLFLGVFLGLTVLTGCDSSSTDVEAEIFVEDITIGTGSIVAPGQTLIVEYVGRLEDGTIFDSSQIQEENLIFTLGVNNVIEGLDEGIPGMRVGGVRRIEIPPHKAFGRNGMCTSEDVCPVPPNATVTFEITVVDILDYVIIEEVLPGTGDIALDGSVVEIEFVGILQDGRVIGSSQSSGPLRFVLGGGFTIIGLEIGIRGMKVGGVRLLTIPPELAYGRFGDGGNIPPYAILQYRIELVRFIT